MIQGELNLEETNDNLIVLEGYFTEQPIFSHVIFGEDFYVAPLSVDRLSDSKDILNITISSKLLKDIELKGDVYTRITGQLRSYNKLSGNKNKLLLTVFAKEISFPVEKAEEPNLILLTGFVCKEPVYRQTPFGREITDLLIAVNRQFNKTDYIPVLAWGRNAKFSKMFKVGEKIHVQGRLQSRTYDKIIEDGTLIKKTAYEVSSSLIDLLEENEDDSTIDETMTVS